MHYRSSMLFIVNEIQNERDCVQLLARLSHRSEESLSRGERPSRLRMSAHILDSRTSSLEAMSWQIEQQIKPAYNVVERDSLTSLQMKNNVYCLLAPCI